MRAKTERKKSWLLKATVTVLLNPTTCTVGAVHRDKSFLHLYAILTLHIVLILLTPSFFSGVSSHVHFSSTSAASVQFAHLSVHKQNCSARESATVRPLPFLSSVILHTSHFQMQFLMVITTGEHSCPPGVYTDTPSQGERNLKQEAGTVRTTAPEHYCFVDILDCLLYRKIRASQNYLKLQGIVKHS